MDKDAASIIERATPPSIPEKDEETNQVYGTDQDPKAGSLSDWERVMREAQNNKKKD